MIKIYQNFKNRYAMIKLEIEKKLKSWKKYFIELLK